MISIPFRGRVGADGILRLEVPTGLREREVEACVVVAPVASNGTHPPSHNGSESSPEALGWPPGFFEATAGSIQDENFKRWPQGEFEIRDEL